MSQEVFAQILELRGLEQYVQGQRTIAAGWRDAAGAQDVYSRAAQRASHAGNLLTAGVTVPLAGVIAASARLGIAATESESMVKNTFGNMTGEINKWSDNASKRLGLNAYEMRRQAAVMQQMFTGAGFDTSKAADMSRTVVDLKNDLVSFFNVADSDAAGALQSGLAGETEPLRRFGIFLTENTVKAQAFKMGLVGINGELSEQQKIQARFGYIQDTLKKNNVTGDLERTKDSPANRLRRMQNELTQAGADFGMALLPLAEPGIKLLNDLTPPLREAIDLFGKLPAPIQATSLALALGAGPALKLGGFLLNLKSSANAATAAKKALTVATIADTAAEAIKAGVASKEAAAISGVGQAATGTAGKLTALTRMKGAVGAAGAWSAAPATIAGRGIPNALGGYATRGGVAISAALGVGAAVGVRDDMKALGASEIQANLAAGVTGALTTGVSVFFPPARALILAAEGLRLGIDKGYNEPAERAAEAGTLPQQAQDEINATKDKRQRADLYNTLASKAYEAGDTTTAESYRLQALSYIKQSKRDQLQGEKDSFQKQVDASRQADMVEHPERYQGALVTNAKPSGGSFGGYIRGIQGNGAFDGEDDAPPFSVASRLRGSLAGDTGSMDFAANYGNQGLNPNDYRTRLQNSEGAFSFLGDMGKREASVETPRNGETIVRLPRRQADDVADALKRHNRLRTRY